MPTRHAKACATADGALVDLPTPGGWDFFVVATASGDEAGEAWRMPGGGIKTGSSPGFGVVFRLSSARPPVRAWITPRREAGRQEGIHSVVQPTRHASWYPALQRPAAGRGALVGGPVCDHR